MGGLSVGWGWRLLVRVGNDGRDVFVEWVMVVRGGERVGEVVELRSDVGEDVG